MIEGLIHHRIGHGFFTKFLAKFAGHLVLDRAHLTFALELGHGQQGFLDAVTATELVGFGEDFVRHHEKLILDVALLFTAFGGEFFLRGDLRLAAFLTELEGGDEVFLRNLLGGTFVHHHVSFVPDIKQVEIALGHFIVRGVGNKLAVHTGHAHRAQRAGPRNVANHQRGGSAEDTEHVRLIFAISTKQQAVYLTLVEPALLEERPDRAVGEAAGENLLVARTTFAAEIVSGNLAGGVGALAVIHLQREPVLAFAALGGGDDRGHHDRFAHLHCYSTISLLGNITGADGDFFIANFGGYLVFSHFRLWLVA